MGKKKLRRSKKAKTISFTIFIKLELKACSTICSWRTIYYCRYLNLSTFRALGAIETYTGSGIDAKFEKVHKYVNEIQKRNSVKELIQSK